MDMGLVYRVLCLFIPPAFTLVPIRPRSRSSKRWRLA